MDTTGTPPPRGWERVGYFLAQARRPRSARQAANETGVSLRTIQSYERAGIDYALLPSLMADYARKIAGWTEADIRSIFDGGDPPKPRYTGMDAQRIEAISEETQASVLAAIYGLRDVPPSERRRLAALIESLPVTKGDSQATHSDEGEAHAR